jgi:UDP-N-acetylglucosamine--N-acetylmuramyl-(pentapeptide) pyrophosphoryl-undecaprenol N-acetylglucosamine transferase
LRIPVIVHESDLTPGLANRLAFPFAKKICVTFPETAQGLGEKAIVTGSPMRAELRAGEAGKGRRLLGFSNEKKILLIFGGGLGSEILNKAVWASLSDLLKRFQVAHVCGKGKTGGVPEAPGYRAFEYLHEDFPNVIACADAVVSRAGLNSLYELIVLGKPHIAVPLSKKASRGDQIENAEYFAKKGLTRVIPEEEFTAERLLRELDDLERDEKSIREKLKSFVVPDSVPLILGAIDQAASPV